MRNLVNQLLIGAISASVFGAGASADLLSVNIAGEVSATDLSRGPFETAEVGDAVAISFGIDTETDVGFDDIHIYLTTDYTVTINGVTMTASAAPSFLFSTFISFHGFEMTSTGVLMPGGGVEHFYAIPVFGASGPPTFWLPQGSEPQDHQGTFPVSLFDFLNDNAVVDTGAGGPGVDQELAIAMLSIEILGDDACAEDLDEDGTVGFSDLLLLLSAWSDSKSLADLDGSGTVGFGDLLFLLAAWGPCA